MYDFAFLKVVFKFSLLCFCCIDVVLYKKRADKANQSTRLKNIFIYTVGNKGLFFAILSARPKLFIVNCPLSIDLSFSNRTEELHLLLNGRLDSLCARCEELSWVKALANKILALFDVLSCCCLECKLTLCVYVDL